MPRRAILEHAHALEALFLVETGSLEAVGVEEEADAAAAAGFVFGQGDELAAQAAAALVVLQPEVVDVEPAHAGLAEHAADHFAFRVAGVEFEVVVGVAAAHLPEVVGEQALDHDVARLRVDAEGEVEGGLHGALRIGEGDQSREMPPPWVGVFGSGGYGDARGHCRRGVLLHGA